jgi:hypothetical protein
LGSVDDVFDALGGEDTLGPGEESLGVGRLDAEADFLRDLTEFEAQLAEQYKGLAFLHASLRASLFAFLTTFLSTFLSGLLEVGAHGSCLVWVFAFVAHL